MLTDERFALILECVKHQDIVKIQELVERTGASESTIRRDLTELENKKFIKRVHGGARLLKGKLQEASVPEKSSKSLHEKKKIAQFAASKVEKGDCIFIDAGTTTQQMIGYLPHEEIVVVTNGLMHVEELLERGIKTYLIGGAVKPRTNAMVGRGALESIKAYRFDKAFMGTNGVHPEFGYTTPDPEEAQVKELAISLSREVFMLADDSKIGEIAFASFGNIKDAYLIVNELEEETETLYQKQTTVKVVGS
ncbi:DeoR/GlpR family DNA-binding transcription regulator [Jeotgalibacillus sp. ET6]|uniref:DeoR/GlpR family DNA-binding transcription regulator n=1 Tax=Jeotgalibacillus sp. ET6 TaxID=3037260 RepID=UPI0024185246|nr:DeoR/GlpR family DNA-binding transcription regulator [Jeotgalibacillus sp. ET6]MDG5471111.1 DeoR/GlpR family DNA-binding transcription regulator [Jeotgalibacillus sp. ET6]